jgi:hypothetical protein
MPLDTDSDLGGAAPARNELTAAYKALLRDVIDRNPSGLRLRIAKSLGAHRSFLSQITNPADPTPIPAKHVRALFDLCHFSPAERERFLAAYKGAHPKRSHAVEPAAAPAEAATEMLEIPVPVLGDAKKQRELEALLQDFARRLAEILKG